MKRSPILPPPRIAALHDLSCMGRCALTAIVPVLSVMGYQVVPLPTALLSTQTDGYTDLYLRDLTGDMERITTHFESIGVRFRAVYTGFLGSAEQFRTVGRFLDIFLPLADESGDKPFLLVDPVMGDNGKLYPTYTSELVSGVRELCARADVLTPNLTEAALLTGEEYRDTAVLSVENAMTYSKKVLEKLKERYPRVACVITGVILGDGTVHNIGIDRSGEEFDVSRRLCGCSYPGTGDIFASVMLGKILAGEGLSGAVEAAAGFVRHVTERSCHVDYETRAGLSFEPELYRLLPHTRTN